MGYSPFGHGSFSRPDGKGGRVLREIADRNGKTPRQVALAFLTRDGVFAIPKSGNPEHVRENAGALGWQLSDEDAAEVDRAFPAPDHDVPLGML